MRKLNATEKGANKNRSRVKQHRLKNPGLSRGNRKITTHQIYKEIIVSYLWERDGNICAHCEDSLTLDNLSIDHIIPVVAGGNHTLKNVRLAHPMCNFKQGPAIRKKYLGY